MNEIVKVLEGKSAEWLTSLTRDAGSDDEVVVAKIQNLPDGRTLRIPKSIMTEGSITSATKALEQLLKDNDINVLSLTPILKRKAPMGPTDYDHEGGVLVGIQGQHLRAIREKCQQKDTPKGRNERWVFH